jgi:hypothetical protein
MRDTILEECHDGPLVGHGGAKRTTIVLKKSYYWPNLKDSAEEYVKTCLTCQQNRTFNKKQASLLQPLPIPEGSWESVSMDFIVYVNDHKVIKPFSENVIHESAKCGGCIGEPKGHHQELV